MEKDIRGFTQSVDKTLDRLERYMSRDMAIMLRDYVVPRSQTKQFLEKLFRKKYMNQQDKGQSESQRFALPLYHIEQPF